MSSTSNEANAQDRDAVVKKVTDLIAAGDLEGAHRELVRLIRRHSRDPEVNFLLALVRKRLDYDVSAEALFQRAFDLGYVVKDESLEETDREDPKRCRWTDDSGEVSILLRSRPRVNLFEFLGFATSS